MKLPQTGGCQCGKIPYSISEVPQLVYTCHCTDCQRITSSAFSLGVAPFASLLVNRARFSACLIAAGSIRDLSAPIARVGSTACRAAVWSVCALRRSTIRQGYVRPDISGPGASSLGSPLVRMTKFSRDSRPSR